jgi:aminotransferase
MPRTPDEFIASHVRDIPRSGIRDFFEIVQSMKDVISLGIGEPDFTTPWHIREAAMFGLEKGHTGYTSNLGLPSLRRAIASYVAQQTGVQYEPLSEVLVTVGVSEALDLAMRAIINPGDEVVYHEPCYVSYGPTITLAHGIPVPVPTFHEDRFELRADRLAAAITPRTKALLLNYPCNPTGAVLPLAELERIAELCVRHDLLVITDEIYSELVYGFEHRSIAALPGLRERTIYLHGFSKAFAMTGARVGYACAPQPLVEAMMKIHQYGILCASITSQEAALEAIERGAPEMHHMRAQYERRRNLVLARFHDMGLPCFEPRGAFYAFPDIRGTGLSSREFAMRLLEEERVAVVPGPAFGPSGEGHVRCSYATGLAPLETALDRIAAFVQRVRPAA